MAVVGVLGQAIYIYIYIYLCIYWAGGPIRGHEVVQGGVNIINGVRVSKGIG